MSEHENPITLSELRAQYLSQTKPLHHIRRLLFDLGYNCDHVDDLCYLWESDLATRGFESEALLQTVKLRERASELVWCNPAYLVLGAIEDNLRSLETSIHFQLSHLAPYPLHHPDVITPAALTDIRQRLRPLVQVDLTHYQAVLVNLYDSLHHAEMVLHKLCPEQADTRDDDDTDRPCLEDHPTYDPKPF